MAPDGQIALQPVPPRVFASTSIPLGGRRSWPGTAVAFQVRAVASRIACSRLDRFVRPVSGRCAAVAELAALVGVDAGADPRRPAGMRQDLRVGAVPSR